MIDKTETERQTPDLTKGEVDLRKEVVAPSDYKNVTLQSHENARRNYKSTEAPMRLYMDIDCSGFFSVLAYEHLYMVSFNLKNPVFDNFDVIRNIRRGKIGKTAAKEYGPKFKLLRRHFVKYLMEKKLEVMANALKKVEASYMLMPQKTLTNYNDCGIFLMRHLETYKGDPKSWMTDLKHESISQKAHLLKIRAKYYHTILASPLNEKRHQILNEAKVFYNKMTSEKVLSIVLAVSEGKSIVVHGRKDIKRKVLFAEDNPPEDYH